MLLRPGLLALPLRVTPIRPTNVLDADPRLSRTQAKQEIHSTRPSQVPIRPIQVPLLLSLCDSIPPSLRRALRICLHRSSQHISANSSTGPVGYLGPGGNPLKLDRSTKKLCPPIVVQDRDHHHRHLHLEYSHGPIGLRHHPHRPRHLNSYLSEVANVEAQPVSARLVLSNALQYSTTIISRRSNINLEQVHRQLQTRHPLRDIINRDTSRLVFIKVRAPVQPTHCDSARLLLPSLSLQHSTTTLDISCLIQHCPAAFPSQTPSLTVARLSSLRPRHRHSSDQI